MSTEATIDAFVAAFPADAPEPTAPSAPAWLHAAFSTPAAAGLWTVLETAAPPESAPTILTAALAALAAALPDAALVATTHHAAMIDALAAHGAPLPPPPPRTSRAEWFERKAAWEEQSRAAEDADGTDPAGAAGGKSPKKSSAASSAAAAATPAVVAQRDAAASPVTPPGRVVSLGSMEATPSQPGSPSFVLSDGADWAATPSWDSGAARGPPTPVPVAAWGDGDANLVPVLADDGGDADANAEAPWTDADDANVNTLVEMLGIDAGLAERTYRSSNRNVEVAANSLFQ